jgi:hypothetical protein
MIHEHGVCNKYHANIINKIFSFNIFFIGLKLCVSWVHYALNICGESWSTLKLELNFSLNIVVCTMALSKQPFKLPCDSRCKFFLLNACFEKEIVV